MWTAALHRPGIARHAAADRCRSPLGGDLVVRAAKKRGAWCRLTRQFAKFWIEHGALEVHECTGNGVRPGPLTSSTQAVRRQDDERVVSCRIVYESRCQRCALNAQVMAEPRAAAMEGQGTSFDRQRRFGPRLGRTGAAARRRHVGGICPARRKDARVVVRVKRGL